MKKAVKRYKSKVKSSNNIVLENMADFSNPNKKELPLSSIHFDGIDEPVRRSFTLEESDIDFDWNRYWNENA